MAHGRVLAPGFALLDTLVPDDVAQRSPLASAWRQLDLTLNDSIANYAQPELELPVNFSLGKPSLAASTYLRLE